MIKYISVSSEHRELPKSLYTKGENQDKVIYCTYAQVYAEEVEEKFYIAVLDYKPNRSQRQYYIFSDPIWPFIDEERSGLSQKFIDKNFDKLNDLYIEFAKSQGYLENV